MIKKKFGHVLLTTILSFALVFTFLLGTSYAVTTTSPKIKLDKSFLNSSPTINSNVRIDAILYCGRASDTWYISNSGDIVWGTYSEEKVKLTIYDSSGAMAQWWTWDLKPAVLLLGEDNSMDIYCKWNTTGYKAGNYRFVFDISYFYNGAWNTISNAKAYTITLHEQGSEPSPDSSDAFIAAGLKYRIIETDEVAFAGLAKPRSMASVSIPEKVKAGGRTYKVTEIAPNAMKKDNKVTLIRIGKNVSYIGDKAFVSCTKLKSVKGGSGVDIIDNSAFYGCKSLTTFPTMKNLNSIGDSAFRGCAKLKKFTFYSSNLEIGRKAFNNCKSLKTITVKAIDLSEDSIGAGAFKGINSRATFICPFDMIEEYKMLFIQKGAPATCIFR